MSTKTARWLVDDAVASLNTLVVYMTEHPSALPLDLQAAIIDADLKVNQVQDVLADPAARTNIELGKTYGNRHS